MPDRPDLAARLRDLAARVDDLDPARLVGELEALKFSVWTQNMSPPRASAEETSAMLNTRAAAHILGISPTALRRLTAGGEVPVCRFGRRVLYRRETLERLRVERERNGRG